jgi:hypothetical protein
MANLHRWKIYRSGGVDQVALQSRDDLVNLAALDPKLWIALSMPTRGVEIDARTLDLLDSDKDGFVRQPEVLDAVKWTLGVYKDVGQIFDGGDSVALDRLKDGPVLGGARRLLANLGKRDAQAVSLADATGADRMFADTVFNGDGVVPADAATGDVKSVIEDIITTHGSVPDRSGKPGVDKTRIDAFFTEAKAVVAWYDKADQVVLPLATATEAAAAAVRAVRCKIDDFFTRCRLAVFDARAAAALNASDAEFAALSSKELSASSAEVANLPIARIEAHGTLPLEAGINPAWRARLATLASDAVTPVLGAREVLSEADWQKLVDGLDPYEAWRAGRPANAVDSLAIERLRVVLAHEAAVLAVLEQDLAVKPEVDSVGEVERLCRYQRDLGTLLTNYVNFSSFYSRKGGIFQAGTLYLDGRGCNLVFDVTNPAKHAAMAPMAGVYLAYCDCLRAGGEKTTIAAAFTAGDVDNLFVGRNGVFVDRKGRDWQATITKVIDNPISIRQAFWAPYKKMVRSIEERVAKKAAAAAEQAQARLDAAAAKAAEIARAEGPVKPDEPAKPPAVAAATAVVEESKKGIDIGTVAALGVAVGGIAAVITAIMAGVFGLGRWAPLGIVAIMLAISAPSMLLAFMKWRRRNLGPLLDANGWAINALTRINVPFGTALTDRATLPVGAQRDLTDPYAEKGRPWKTYIVLVILVSLAAGWYLGKLDRYLPSKLRSTTVLGDAAPAASTKDATSGGS